MNTSTGNLGAWRRTAVGLVLAGMFTVAGVRTVPAAMAGRTGDDAGPRLIIALQQPAGAPDEFVPVDELPAPDPFPAAPLLIGAYIFVWAALLVYLLMLWRRIGRVEHELATLSRQVDERRRS